MNIPARQIIFKDWKPIQDKVVELMPVIAYFIFQEKNKQPGGYYANGHEIHYYKVDGFDYDKALKNVL